jgi:hypothetical protein
VLDELGWMSCSSSAASTDPCAPADAKGRHHDRTPPSHRPRGGVVIDTPGIRAVGLAADTDAVDAGDLPAARLASWRSLRREALAMERRTDPVQRRRDGKRSGRMAREA